MNSTILKKSLAPAAALLLLGASANAQLVLNTDLGDAPENGTINAVADTSIGGVNNCDTYNPGDAALGAAWGQELVYSFNLETDSPQVTVTRNSVTNDPDIFLLNSLIVGDVGNGLRTALGFIAPAYLDVGDGEAFNFGPLLAGTYYIVVDSFSQVSPTSEIDFTLTFGLPEPSEPIDLGNLNVDPDEPFTLDTFGSGFDTELGLYDDQGNPLFDNDDADGGLQSQLDIFAGLPAGSYNLFLGGWDTAFNPGPDVVGGGSNGPWTLNYPGGIETGTLLAGDVQQFIFTIGGPSTAFKPEFTEIITDGVNTILTWTSQPGKFYSIDGSPDMLSWTNLEDFLESGGEFTTFPDSTGNAKETTYFFRVTELP